MHLTVLDHAIAVRFGPSVKCMHPDKTIFCLDSYTVRMVDSCSFCDTTLWGMLPSAGNFRANWPVFKHSISD